MSPKPSADQPSSTTAVLRLPPGTRPTARDVATLAGVSPSTVSRVLNDAGTALIGRETQARVRAAAIQLGYSPHPLARALRGKHTQLIGLIVREIDDPFFAGFIAELSAQARELGYQIVLGHAESDASQALQMTAVLDTRHCDGVLLLGDLRDDGQATEEMLKANRAVVALCRGRSRSAIPTVNLDNATGMGLLLEHLHGLGHRRLAFVSGGWLGDIGEREEAFRRFVQERDLPALPDYVQTETNSLEGGYRALQRLLALPTPPTAVLAADDVMAVGALKAAVEAGRRVPQDLSITGFDDIAMARFTHPALTTVHQPIETMSQRAMAKLLNLIANPEPADGGWTTTVMPELVVRASTGPAPAQAPVAER
jgi:LacI family transcriptional regulator